MLFTTPLNAVIGTSAEDDLKEAININGFERLQLDKSDNYLQMVKRL